MKKYSIADRRAIIDRVKRLNLRYEEYVQIFLKIKENNIPYTENSNGIFIDLKEIGNKILEEIDKILNICENERKRNELIV